MPISMPILTILMITLICSFSLARLEDPFMNRSLTGVDPFRFAEGICPGHPLKNSIHNKRSENSLEPLELDLKFIAAFEAAQNVYQLPDLEMFNKGEDFAQHLELFHASVPKGYRFFSYYADPETGIKYMILAPLNEKHEWILSLAGTQSALDWIVDLDLGHSQLEKLRPIRNVLSTCLYLDENKNPLATKNWIITGHSLGGGLAQAFAYLVQESRIKEGLNPLNLYLVTFNGFGAQELIEKTQSYNPEIAETLFVKNYFVEGDPISRIGRHIGPTFELKVGHPAGLSPKELVKRHLLDQIASLMQDRLFLSPLSTALAAIPPHFQVINQLTGMGSFFRFLPEAIYEQSEEKEVRLLIEAGDEILSWPMTTGAQQSAKAYLKRLVFTRINNLKKDSNGLMRSLRVKDLEALQRRLR